MRHQLSFYCIFTAKTPANITYVLYLSYEHILCVSVDCIDLHFYDSVLAYLEYFYYIDKYT